MKNLGSLRLKIMLAALVAVGVLAAASMAETWMMKNELSAHGEAHAEAFRDGENEVAYTVTVSREFGLFGQAMGKVTAFARPKGANDTDALHAVDYFYVKQGGEWINTDSGSCTHEGCLAGADGAFARATRSGD